MSGKKSWLEESPSASHRHQVLQSALRELSIDRKSFWSFLSPMKKGSLAVACTLFFTWLSFTLIPIDENSLAEKEQEKEQIAIISTDIELLQDLDLLEDLEILENLEDLEEWQNS